MLRHLMLLFVGVLNAVGVNTRGLALATATPSEKHWPSTGTSRNQAAAMTVLFVWIMLFVWTMLMVGVLAAPLAVWRW
jgi:hypothetical protein